MEKQRIFPLENLNDQDLSNPVFTNVRKKGRPPYWNEELRKEIGSLYALYGFEKSYRQRIMDVKAWTVMYILLDHCGEDMSAGFEGVCQRPVTSAKFPWLMGKKVQMTVLAELHKVPAKYVVEFALAIEEDHHGMTFNEIRRHVRKLIRVIFRPQGRGEQHRVHKR